MGDPNLLVPLLVAGAGLGLTAFVLLALAVVSDFRSPAVVALAVGLAALSVDAALGSLTVPDGSAALRLLAAYNVADALVAPAFLLHLRWITEDGTPRDRLAQQAALPLVAAVVAVVTAIADDAGLDKLASAGHEPGWAVVVAAMVGLVTVAILIVQGATLVAAHRIVAALPTAHRVRPWAGRLIAWLTGLFLLAVAAPIASLAGILDEATARLADLPAVVALYAIALAALIHRDVFRRVAAAVAPEKYARSTLDDGRVDDVVGRARRALETGRLFADPNLSLGRLAAAAGVRPNDLSQALNRSGTGYADFVSARRIEEVCRLLADPAEANRSILDIAVSVGFNAKSTFNTAFVRHAGMTPSAFRAARVKAEPHPSV